MTLSEAMQANLADGANAVSGTNNNGDSVFDLDQAFVDGIKKRDSDFAYDGLSFDGSSHIFWCDHVDAGGFLTGEFEAYYPYTIQGEQG